MGRHKENKESFKVSIDSEVKRRLDADLVKAGYSYNIKGVDYPMYGKWLEALHGGDKKALGIIFEKVLDRLE
jgi:hypothetical protein